MDQPHPNQVTPQYNVNVSLFRIGRLLGLLGGIEGTIAVVVVALPQLVNFFPSYSQMPLVMAWTIHGGGVISLALIGSAFVALGISAYQSRPTQRKWQTFLVFPIGTILTVLSVLSIFTVGSFILPGAAAGLVGGLFLLISYRSQSTAN
jgi:energy-converting hydrogenase Eha subunit A